MNILMVLTSHDKLGSTGRKTGLWLEELAAPYYLFAAMGATVVLASPRGGRVPVDPKSRQADAQTEATVRFQADRRATAALAKTEKLSAQRAADFDGFFYPGGHGPLWDLAEDEHSIALIEAATTLGLPVALVCHGPAALRHVKGGDGRPLVHGRSVTGYSDSEEAASGLVGVVPFLVEDMLKKNGGHYTKAPNWQPHVVTDGLLVTGQNPASSAETGRALLRALAERERARQPTESAQPAGDRRPV
ncbi:MAG: type 1 glutamine amidotransferase domain-containing protein [Planctomycetes bacterium]|nr:type 1 glutamine amidotransferase domain-containing protein [Planctomycetota bacterium]